MPCAWTGRRDYVNVSEQFKDFYKRQMGPLKRELSAIEVFWYKDAWYCPAKTLLKAEVALFASFLLASPRGRPGSGDSVGEQ
jgi:hypothetical protein